MNIEEAKQEMDRIAKDIKQIIANAPTPEMRHELATDFIKWLKNQQKGKSNETTD